MIEIIQNIFLRFLYNKQFNISCPLVFSSNFPHPIFNTVLLRTMLFTILNTLIDILNVIINIHLVYP